MVDRVSSANQPVSGLYASSRSVLDKDAFLKLLVTQLQNQDPTQPLDDREMIAQMAQFSTLEQIHNLNQTAMQMFDQQSMANAALLIGRQVAWLEDDSVQTGVVDFVKKSDGQYFLGIGGQLVKLDDVIQVELSDG